MYKTDYPDDCKKLQGVLMNNFNVEATLFECQEMWKKIVDDTPGLFYWDNILEVNLKYQEILLNKIEKIIC